MCRMSLFFIALLCLSADASAQWVVDGVPATGSSDHTEEIAIVTDGADGAIVVWATGLDSRSERDLRAQRFDPLGYRLWGSIGVPVCSATGTQYDISAAADGNGGVVIAWADKRTGVADVYAQHLDASGAAQWTTDGVPVCTATEQQDHVRLLSRGGGAALIVWQDRRNDPGATYDIYIQYVDPTGTPQWTADGNPVCLSSGSQTLPRLVTDTEAGAIVTWADGRGTDLDIYAQKINFLGAAAWTTNGAPVSGYAGDQTDPQIAADGAGGAVIVWNDYRWVGPAADVYGQRLLPNGSRDWTGSIDGVGIAVFGATALNPKLASIGSDGFILTWLDQRASSDQHVYANRVDLNGVRYWSGGLDLTPTGNHLDATITADESGGAVVAWRDNVGPSSDIRARRLDINGNNVWPGNGMQSVCSAVGDQIEPAVIWDPSGPILAWRDRRGTEYRPFAQRVIIVGSGVDDTPRLSDLQVLPNSPNPFGATTTLRFRSGNAAPLTLEVFDVAGRRIATRSLGTAAGWRDYVFDGRDDAGHLLPGGVYVYRVSGAGQTQVHKMTVAR